MYRTLKIVRRGDEWIVTFDDGRYFHPWSPGEQVKHPCGADLYTGRIDIERAHDPRARPVMRWTTTWTVTGPSKNYTMTTIFTNS